MTHEEIEAARERIASIINTYQGIAHFGMGGTPEQVQECVAALTGLDALVEAAKAAQPERLTTGTKIRGKNWPDDQEGEIVEGPLYRVSFRLGESMCRHILWNRNNFELIEPTGEKGGDVE